jgi:sister-chromatid-cohesion protein PDS5
MIQVNTVQKELRKRIEENSPSPTLLDTLTPLLFRVSLLCFNKSHVPAVIEFTRTDDKGLSATAHEVLKEISTKHPKVFSTHVKDLCKTLENEAPTAKTSNPSGAVDDLKACASFAKKFPKDVPLNGKDSRKLVQGLLNFALYGSPAKAAKHAVTIIISSDSKKEMHAKEILKKSIKNFEYGCDHWLTKLAAISQLVLLAQQECEDDIDALVAIAVENVLLKPHTTSPEAEEEWMEVPDDDMAARTWALKILVNRLLSLPAETNLSDTAAPVFKLLNRMVKEGGEASKKNATPLAHRNRQRLLASNFLLKLACQRRLDSQISPTDFNELALVTHDGNLQVRKGFALKLMKYLGQNRLTTRYYSILFLFAHEPDTSLKEVLTTWIRSRRAMFAARKETVLETSVFARLLSLIAHHPDFSSEELVLKQMSSFILYYLKCVATEENLALIYHMAGRVKTVKDAIDPSGKTDENLYILSDLAQALILLWEDQNGWSMQTFPGKQKLPGGIFKPLESHERGQEIAQKQYIDKDFADELEPLVRKAIKSKKRKAGDGVDKARKKIKSEKKDRIKAERVTKTPRKRRRAAGSGDEDEMEGAGAASGGPTRKSDRRSGANKSYVEVSSDDDEANAGAGAEEDEAMSDAESQDSDVDMEEAEKSPTPEPADVTSEQSEEEPEPEPEPPKKTPKKTPQKKAAKKSNGTKLSSPVPSSAAQRRRKAPEPEPEPVEEATPAKATKAAKGKGKGKTKVNGAAEVVSSSPVANGTATGSVRRSGRTRS